ncbi:hypothetical protein ACIBFB_23585 [Nocardiopsis sp. NPDC050513]
MATCAACKGEGTIVAGGDGSGPWSDKEVVTCGDCNGTGEK